MNEIKAMNNDEIRDFCIKKDLKIYELEKQLQQKENIIKEVREYIEERKKYKGEPFYLDEIQTEIVCEILDKENKGE